MFELCLMFRTSYLWVNQSQNQEESIGKTNKGMRMEDKEGKGKEKAGTRKQERKRKEAGKKEGRKEQ